MSDKEERVEQVCTAIEKAVTDCGLAAISSLPKFMQAIRMAKGIREMRLALTDQFVSHALMPIMNTPLGFMTDRPNSKNPTPYGIDVVRDCSIEAMIRGLNVVGNEFNIIADRCYGTKNGYERLVLEFPGLSGLDRVPGGIEMVGPTAIVQYQASWKLNGAQQSMACTKGPDFDARIPVRVNGGMGVDAILGKAERKLLFRIYKRLYGSTFGAVDGEIGDIDAINTTADPAPIPVPPGAQEGRRYSVGKSKRQPTGGTAPVANGAAVQASDAPAPPQPVASSPAAAPVDVTRLVQMLREADPDWDDPDFDAGATVRAWSESQRAEAFAWAKATLNDGPMAIQSRKPAHAVLGRQPGEEG